MKTYVDKTIGNGISTSFAVAHCLGTENVDVSAYDQHGQLTLIDVEVTTKDTVRVNFLFPPKPGEYKVEVSTK